MAILSKLLAMNALLMACVVAPYPALAEQPLYVGDFDGPLHRREYLPPQDIGGNPFGPQELPPAGFSPNMIPARAKSKVDFLTVERNPNGQLFIRPLGKRVALLKLPENQVRFFFGSPLRVRKYDKREKTANLDLVFDYHCYNDSRLSTLILGFEKQVVRRAVVVPVTSQAEE